MEYNMQQFEREFMERTHRLMCRYSGDYDASHLLNCMLGLLIVPRERLFNAIPCEPIAELAKWGVSPDSILACERGNHKPHQLSIRWFVIKLRNAVAHCHILPVHRCGEVFGFEFWDRSGFRAVITITALKKFVTALSERIVNAIDRPDDTSKANDDTSLKWKKGARLFTRTMPERVYVIDCPDGFERQCYEISSSCAEFYVFGSRECIPSEGATDICIEPLADRRREKVAGLTIALSAELPRHKRLSIYTNDDVLTEHLLGITDFAKARLEFFGIFRIAQKRQQKGLTPVVA